jgi:hypothetical protein
MPLSDDAVSPLTKDGDDYHMAHDSVAQVLDEIKRRYADVPFLALGQTVFWDEPTKAVWRRLLDNHAVESRMITGVHDTDYFAKLSTQLHTDEKYAIVPHDDGVTRDLWSAAGELSALFGSESIPTRQMFLDRGVPFDWLTKYGPGDKASRYAALTSAWGWRGLVRTDQHNVVACDIPAIEIANALLRLLDWGFTVSLGCLGSASENANQLADKVRGWVSGFLEDCSDSCRLTELYETLLPRFYELLLGQPPTQFETTASTELFRFNTDTASSPKFRILDVFLNGATRATASRAYSQAVRRSGIYDLDHFGEGAIPFDLVVPQKGRGTIFLRGSRVLAQLGGNDPVEIASGTFNSAMELAAAVEERFGRRTALVGKAVILADMIAAEHLVLFHETASGYTGITRKFNESLAAAGIRLDLYPIVRITYPTWDALADVDSGVSFRLPDHLAAAFGNREIAAADLGKSWRDAVEKQKGVLADSRSLHKLRDLLTYLDAQDPKRETVPGFESLIGGPLPTPVDPAPQYSKPSPCWCDLLADYERALKFLRENAEKSAILRNRIDEHRDELRIWQKERIELEIRKGDDWRASVLPLMHKLADVSGDEAAAIDRQLQRQLGIRSTAFEEPLAILKERIDTTKTLIASFRRERRRLERSLEARQARATIAGITQQAQAARLMLVRNAYLSVEGLTHTQLRPTAWWLPLVDSSGQWFESMVNGTRARFEHLWPE